MSNNLAQSFLDDITAHPDDDTPRLIFADWLEERGNSERAEFIRVQIERSRLPDWDARQVRLRLRERALIEQHGQKWKNELPNIAEVRWEEFRRGFVATAMFSNFAALSANASTCWAAAPIEAISIICWPRPHDTLDNIAPIAGLRELYLGGRVVDLGDVDRLADSPLLSTLRVLNLRYCNLGVEGFRRLVASPFLENLTALCVPSNSIGNGGVSALFDAVSLIYLEELELSESDNYGRYGEDPIIGAIGVELLTGWPGMRRLRSMTLSGNSIGRDGLRALLCSPRATGLKELVLRDNGLNGSAMKEFRHAHPELQLDVLDLGANLLRNVGPAELAKASCLRELKALIVDRCDIELSGARRLAEAPFFDSLRQLNANHNSFGPKGLRALLEKNPRHLHTLQLVFNGLGEEGVSRLAESAASDTLLEVNLAYNELGNGAVASLIKSSHLRELLVLRFAGNPIDKLDAVALANSALGKRLAILEITERPDEDIPF